MANTATINEMVGDRYQLLDALGKGGMGVVYRAFDRLTRQAVALKRVATRDAKDDVNPRDTMNIRLALANEFQLLASLHHPHIIDVLDYGFDGDKQPYFAMTLLDQPQPVTRAALGQPLNIKLKYWVEMLQALAYLHRRGIVHRDLKPDNVLVSASGQLYVLDFGLAVLRETQDPESDISGTLAYMAPEVLSGGSVSEASDLYAVGVMAYELLSGQHPYNIESPGQLVQDILLKPVDLSLIDTDEKLIPIVHRLLAKSPTDRYHDVYDVLRELVEATEYPLPRESVAIRESFLQAARFVGRERELQQLSESLNQAIEGQGNTWLVGGESGVGKSRLLNELRTQALVQGALAIYGQGVEGGGFFYQLWREPLRRLVLSVDLSPLDASILKQIVPDIGELLGRDISDAPEMEGAAGQQRLLETIVSVFQKHKQPTLLILEDLQWTTESMEVLKVLIPVTQNLPLLIVATYRDDERPDLPDTLPGSLSMRIGRLTDEEITRLSESMLGAQGREPHVVALLTRETEGNVFFLVEVVRVLAEEAGGLRDIGNVTLPVRVLAGGMQQVVQRRLSRIPAAARALLDVAAIAGRFLDLELLKQIQPDVDMDDWLITCSSAAVIDNLDEQWRFAHDKLRQGVLTALPAEKRPVLHRQVAEALATIHTHNQEEYAAFIADHYEQAGDLAQAATWFVRAGQHGQETYAPGAAIDYYQKALSFWKAGVDTSESSRLEVYEGLGKMLNWQGQYTQAIEVFQNMRVAAEAAGDIVAQSRAWYRIAEARVRQGDFRGTVEDASKAEALARSVGARLELSMALWMEGWAKFRLGESREVLPLGEEVLAITTELDHQHQMAQTANLIGVAHYTLGNYAESERYFAQAMEGFQRVADRGPAMALMNNLGVLAAARGDYDTAFNRYQNALSVAREIGNRDAEMVYLANLGGARVGLGDYQTAESELKLVIKSVENTGLSELSEIYRFLAEAYLGQGKVQGAQEAAQQALVLGFKVESLEYIAIAWRVLGQVASRLASPIVIDKGGDSQSYDAVTCFTESQRICQETGMEGERARTLRAWASHELQHGDRVKGTTLWQEAREIFTRLNANHEVERMGELPS